MATVRDVTHDLLRRLGMQRIFGNPGSTELTFFRDFPADFAYVLGLQEAVAVGMADGYAQATHNAALVNLHSAVGVGHAMGNIFTAYRNRTPLLITAGQQARGILPFDPFLSSVRATELPALPSYFWLAGESSIVTAIRRHLVTERAVSRDDVQFTGYWRHGVREDER